MKRLLFGLIIIVIALLCLSAAALYSLQKGGYLERRLSKLVEHDEHDKFGFEAVSPNWDLSFDIIKPKFSRGVLLVEAEKVTVLPRYSTLHTARPVAESFVVHNAKVTWPTASISGLTITGTCPQSADKLRLEGKISAKISSKVLNGPGQLLSSFKFEPSILSLPDIRFEVGDKKLRASLELKPTQKDNAVDLKFDFGESAPTFNVTTAVSCQPIGSLALAASLPHRKQLQRVLATVPLSQFSLRLKSGDIETRTQFIEGELHVENEVLNIKNVAIALSNGLKGAISGTISEFTKEPIYRLNVTSEKMSVTKLLSLLPSRYRNQVGSRKLFGSIDVQGVIKGKGKPEPTARISLAGLGCEMDVDGKKRQIVFKSGSLSLKRGRRLVLSGVDISLSGIIAKIAGNVIERDGKWEGEGRATVRDLTLPALVPLLPSRYADTLAQLSPNGFISTEVRASLSRGVKPSIQGAVELNGISLTLPKEVGGAKIKLNHASIRLDDESAYLEPCTIKLGSANLSAKGRLINAFTKPKIQGDIGGKDISFELLLALLPEKYRKTIPIKNPQGGISLRAQAATNKGNVEYSATVDLSTIGGTLYHKDNEIKLLLPKGTLELTKGKLTAKELTIKTMGHLFKPEINILFDDKVPTINASLPATMVKLEETAPYLPNSVPKQLKDALSKKSLRAKVYIAGSAKGKVPALELEGKATAQNISYTVSKNQPKVTVDKVTCRLTNKGLELSPFTIAAGKNEVQVTLDEKGKLLVLLGKMLKAKELAQLAPPKYVAVAKGLAPSGALSVKAYVPLKPQPGPPTVDLKLHELSVALPIKKASQRVALSASLRWRHNELKMKQGLISYEKIGLRLNDGIILKKAGADYLLSLSLNGDVAVDELLSLLPETKNKLKDIALQGSLALAASANGPLSDLTAQASFTPKELGAEVSVNDITLSPKVQSGALIVDVKTKGDEISAQGELKPPIQLTAAGASFNITGFGKNLTKEPTLEFELNSSKIPITELLARLPAELCASAAAFSPQGALTITGSFKGSPPQLDGLIDVKPSDLSVTLPVPGKTMKAELIEGSCKLKAFVRKEKTVVNAILSPAFKLKTKDASLIVKGQLKDLTGTKECAVHAISSPLPISLATALAPSEFQEKIASLGLQGTFKISGQVSGPIDNAKTTASLLPAGLSVRPQASPIPITAKVLSGEVGLLSQKQDDGSTKASVTINKALKVQALGCTTSISGKINDFLGQQALALKIALLQAPLNSVIQKVCKLAKIDAPSLAAGLSGQPKKAVVSITGTAKDPSISSWADLAGIALKHPALAKPLAISSGRVASRKSGGFLWKDLKINLGAIAIKSAGVFKGTLAEGEFIDAKVESAFELKELPPLLKLEKSLASNGKAELLGDISGKLSTPVVKGTLSAPGKFSLRITGAQKPFRIDLGDIKTNWNFSSKSGKLTLADIEGMIAHGLIAGNATVSVMAEEPVHECEVLFADMNMDKFLRRGANIGGLLRGTFGLEFKGKLTGGLNTLEGSGLTDIYDCELNGNKLIKVAGFDKYFPKKDKKHRGIGGMLLQVATEGLLSESAGGKKLLRVRDVLHHSFGFGQVSGKVVAKDGKLLIAPITSKDGSSSLSGTMTVDLNKLALDGLTSFRLVREPDVLTINDLAMKGTISEPKFDLPLGPIKSFKFRSLTKSVTPKKPEIGSDKSDNNNSVIIER